MHGVWGVRGMKAQRGVQRNASPVPRPSPCASPALLALPASPQRAVPSLGAASPWWEKPGSLGGESRKYRVPLCQASPAPPSAPREDGRDLVGFKSHPEMPQGIF